MSLVADYRSQRRQNNVNESELVELYSEPQQNHLTDSYVSVVCY